MARLIDDKEATVARILELYKLANSAGMFNRLIEELYAPIPDWKDKLDPNDSDTWVLCFVSDYSETSRECVVWVTRCECGPYPFTTVPCGLYKYATPVDLNIRYKGES
tara:strand:- start:408 stop:731 length:324 start_codon:yes stop_codon:yes gene_type:complete